MFCHEICKGVKPFADLVAITTVIKVDIYKQLLVNLCSVGSLFGHPWVGNTLSNTRDLVRVHPS